MRALYLSVRVAQTFVCASTADEAIAEVTASSSSLTSRGSAGTAAFKRCKAAPWGAAGAWGPPGDSTTDSATADGTEGGSNGGANGGGAAGGGTTDSATVNGTRDSVWPEDSATVDSATADGTEDSATAGGTEDPA